MNSPSPQNIFGILRIGMGWIFFWAFIDKVFGLGFATSPAKAWTLGNSPTAGFLKSASKGPLASLYQSIAGHPVVDWLFMMGLLLVGLALLLGIGVKIAGYAGALQMFLIWTTRLPPQQNPFLDEHIIYILILIIFTQIPIGSWFGLGRWWGNTSLVKRYLFLQ